AQAKQLRSAIKKDEEDDYREMIYGYDGSRQLISVSDDEKTLVLTDGWMTMHAFNLDDGKELKAIVTKKDLSLKGFNLQERRPAAACSPDGKLLALRVDGDAERGRRFTPDGEPVVQGKSALRLFDLQAGRELW